MRGYTIDIGYMGMVDGKYILFACEADYREYLEDWYLKINLERIKDEANPKRQPVYNNNCMVCSIFYFLLTNLS